MSTASIEQHALDYAHGRTLARRLRNEDMSFVLLACEIVAYAGGNPRRTDSVLDGLRAGCVES